MGKAKTYLSVTSAVLASALRDADIDVNVFYVEEPEAVPEFKLLRTDPAFNRKKTHPTSFRKNR